MLLWLLLTLLLIFIVINYLLLLRYTYRFWSPFFLSLKPWVWSYPHVLVWPHFGFTLKSTIVDSFSISYRHRQMHSAVISNACTFNIPQKTVLFSPLRIIKMKPLFTIFYFSLSWKKKNEKKNIFKFTSIMKRLTFHFCSFLFFSFR